MDDKHKEQLEVELTKLIKSGYKLTPDTYIYPFERKNRVITGHFAIDQKYYRFIKGTDGIEVLEMQ